MNANAAPTEAAGDGPTVLLVDDELRSIEAMRRTLDDEFQVLSAQSAEAAAELMARHEVAVILCDQRMPGCTGVQFLVRARERWPDAVRSAVQARQLRGGLERLDLELRSGTAAAGRAAPALWITIECDDATTTLRLRDNGPGIAPEHMSCIFDPFFTTKPVGKGTGLGLSISYGLVEQHGGRLSAANAEGGGAVFTAELPSAAPRRDVGSSRR